MSRALIPSASVDRPTPPPTPVSFEDFLAWLWERPLPPIEQILQSPGR